jgi:hypothetical protein
LPTNYTAEITGMPVTAATGDGAPQGAVQSCAAAEIELQGCPATSLLEATMSTIARFPDSMRDI